MSAVVIGVIVVVVVVALIALMGAGASVRVLREYERGVVFRLGRLIDQRGPGVVLLIPGVDRLVRISLRTVTLCSGSSTSRRNRGGSRSPPWRSRTSRSLDDAACHGATGRGRT
jgi:regulator of protease activity HflC (stomatin/prohibitin superfamily)